MGPLTGQALTMDRGVREGPPRDSERQILAPRPGHCDPGQGASFLQAVQQNRAICPLSTPSPVYAQIR